MQHIEDIILVDKYHKEKHQRMNKKLAQKGHNNVVIGSSQPFLASVKLHFHANRIGRKQCHEEHQNARHENGRQTVVVTALRIGYHVGIDGHRLQCSLNLIGCGALGTEHGLSHGC